ncbi:MAG TPA: maleylpyruvate isomerase N-terminal domain-containing protein [Bacteroidota bacterium]|nr:maleylpyruvate isomerase N-terminal domain-containing protein [Bacteroidota bacterium]
MKNVEPISVTHLFPELDALLLGLLRGLPAADWNRPTVAPAWTIKDVVAHLVDGNVRALSIMRDSFWGESAGDVTSYDEQVLFLNKLNADWVRAFRRVSPAVLVMLLESTGREYCGFMQSLDPMAPSPIPVAWAGESTSLNWFHVAREYTEKWHHQQQIRLAVNDGQTLLSDQLYLPYLDTSMRALPHQYRNVSAPDGTVLRFRITGVAAAEWFLVRSDGRWSLCTGHDGSVACNVEIDKDIAWKILTKAMKADQGLHSVRIEGDRRLGEPVLSMVAVMA